MTRKTLIIVVAIFLLILLVGSLWLYSLLNGSPQRAEETFANLPWNGTGTDEFFIDDSFPNDEFPQINLDGPSLRQLTFLPVIGYNEIIKNGIRTMRYVEAGTGHVYDINLETGQEERMSNITIQNAHEALVSQFGAFALIRAGYTSTSDIKLLIFRNGEVIESTLPYNMITMTLSADDTIYYTARSDQGLAANELTVASETSETLFTVPFMSANIGWAIPGIRPHHVYTKPASELLGYAYEINDQGNLVRLPFVGNGLTTIHTGDYIMYSRLNNNEYVSYIYDRASGEIIDAPIVTLPEKCAQSVTDTTLLFCGHELTRYDHRFPDNWYKGVTTYNDNLWTVNLRTGSAIQLANPELAVGRQLDVSNINNSPDGQMIYFLNRTDKTLWVYEIDN